MLSELWRVSTLTGDFGEEELQELCELLEAGRRSVKRGGQEKSLRWAETQE